MVSLLDSGAVSVYRRLFTYVTPHWRVIVVAVAAMFFFSAANGYVPFLIEDVIEILGDAGSRRRRLYSLDLTGNGRRSWRYRLRFRLWSGLVRTARHPRLTP